MELLRRLEIFKKDNKLTNKDLAALWGVSIETVKSYWRPNAPRVPKAYLEKIASTYKDVTLDWLLTGTSTKGTIKEPEVDYRKAKAGRTESVNHLVKIRQLLMKAVEDFPEGQYELFDVDGNSMSRTLVHGDKLLCRMVSLDEIIDTRVYVIVTNKSDLAEYRKSGIWVKRLTYRKANGYINCYSDNKDSVDPFPTFRLKPSEIEEVWYPMLRLCADMSDPHRDIYDKLDDLEARLEMLESLNE